MWSIVGILDFMYWIPKAGLVISAAILLGFITIGLALGESWICDGIGLMGTDASCVEEVMSSYMGLIPLVSMIFFAVWWAIIYMNKASKPKK